jgi:hypothetical protein
MIRRTYQCRDCEREFIFECAADDPDPPCPNPKCDQVLDWRPISFAIGGSIEGKAAAYTYKALEQDYGLTDFRDNARPGDSGIITRPETKVEAEAVEREYRAQISQLSPEKTAQFWGESAGAAAAAPGNAGIKSMTGQSLLAMAKVGPQAGFNAMTDLQNKIVKGGISRDPRTMIKEGYRTDFNNPARKRG